MAKKNVGYDQAQEAIKSVLVNGIDQFQKLSVFIHTIMGMVETPSENEAKSFFEGVVDACTEAWKSAKASEIADLEAERVAVDQEYKEELERKKIA